MKMREADIIIYHLLLSLLFHHLYIYIYIYILFIYLFIFFINKNIFVVLVNNNNPETGFSKLIVKCTNVEVKSFILKYIYIFLILFKNKNLNKMLAKIFDNIFLIFDLFTCMSSVN